MRALLLLFTFWMLLSSPQVQAEEVRASSKRQIHLEFEEIEGASSYELELTSARTKKSQLFKMKTAKWSAEIKPGNYELKIRSVDKRGVPGEWSEGQPFVVKLPGPVIQYPTAQLEIKTNEEDKYDLPLKWESIPGINQYRVDITNTDNKNKFTESFGENHGTLTLPVAHNYSVLVTPIADNGQEGEAQDQPITFSLIGKKIHPPEIEKPEDIWVTELKWEKPEYTENYSYVLQRRTDAKAWETVETQKNFGQENLKFGLDKQGGHYRLAVKAEGRLRETSNFAIREFDVYSGDRSPASVEEAKLRYSLEKPTPWYFVASYLLTNVSYLGVNPEVPSSSHLRYTALGGTGRLGLGYIPPNKNLGFLGLVDLSGFTIENKNQTYASAELHAVWRYTQGRNLLRASSGLFYKELVESKKIDTTPTSSYFTHAKIAYAGPHAGFDFWRPFSPKLGLQLNARIYTSLVGITTPNGRKISPEIFYQLGFLGSYKIKPEVTGFLGWAYRLDKATYESSPTGSNGSQAPSGSTQQVQIEGNYLNLLLEWGF